MVVDQIFIKNLKIKCIVGILPHERSKKQTIIVNLKVGSETTQAANSQSLDDTIDYAKLAKSIRELVISGKYLLLETMAEDMARFILDNPLANDVIVTIEKPEAVINTESVGVEIHRAH